MDKSQVGSLNYLITYFTSRNLKFEIKAEIDSDSILEGIRTIKFYIYRNCIVIEDEMFDYPIDKNELGLYLNNLIKSQDILSVITVVNEFHLYDSFTKTIEDVKRLKINKDNKKEESCSLDHKSYKFVIGYGKVSIDFKQEKKLKPQEVDIKGILNLPTTVILETYDPIKLTIQDRRNKTMLYLNKEMTALELINYLEYQTGERIRLMYDGIILNRMSSLKELNGKALDIMF